MADVGTILTLTQTLFGALKCSILKEIFSVWGYKSELEELKETVSTITKVLLDAEAQQVLSNEEQHWIEKLKEVVYDADDLFDEILAFAGQKKQNDGSKFIGEVRDFFSSDNQFSVAYTMSRRVKKIKKKLDAFADNHRKFGSVVDSHQPVVRRVESCSYTCVDDVIGREDDLEALMPMLLDSDFGDGVGIVTIVGVGGLGKTTLAQLVYHDERVAHEFPLRLWACVSDQNGEQFDVKSILAKILESATSQKQDGFGMNSYQSELQVHLGGKRYLLVLDDVWTEDRYKWLDLRKFLILGGKGSRVVVTTRSKITASIIGSEHSTYELKGLSKVDSWRLFEMTAFGTEHNLVCPLELVEIGEKIIEKCHNAPLAIKVVGSLLFGQDTSKWRSFQETGLAKIRKGENEVMSVLKLSYNNLESPLKTCFRFCALFPKNFAITKSKLIYLWMAQQYIVPFDEGQCIEDAGEEYFSVLLRRCFFHDVIKDEYGDVKSVKIHDLMHDVAQDVAGKEICLVNSITSNLADTIRHMFHVGNTCTKSFSKLKIRSYLRDGYSQFQVTALLESWRWLRILDLHDLGIKSLPDSIGKLVHLRYINLSGNRNLSSLPDSVTKLYNLQTLDLCNCFMFKSWPKDFNKLVNLKHLLVNGCTWLLHMPQGLNKLTCLHALSKFVVGNDDVYGKHCVGQLKDLKALKNLRGNIDISIYGSGSDVKENDSEEGYLKSTKHLKGVSIIFEGCHIPDKDYEPIASYHESVLKDLQPHPNLKNLVLSGFQGLNTPFWGREWTTFLPNLVKIKLEYLHSMQILPSLSKLCHLKSLELAGLQNLEYIEDTSSSSSSSNAAELAFFPSLDKLVIRDLPKLKGWWRVEELIADPVIDSSNSSKQSFSHLSFLAIYNCHNLTSFPLCQIVEQLCLIGLNKTLCIRIGTDAIGFVSSTDSTLSDTRSSYLKLRHVALDDMRYFNTIPVERLTSICISWASELENLSEIGEIFKRCSSVRSLIISFCFRLRSLSGGLEYLTALESLIINAVPMALFSIEDDNGLHWRSLDRTLRSLELNQIPRLEILPEGLQYLTSLQHLKIVSCMKLNAIPEWISCISSLRSLSIIGHNELKSLPNAMQKLTSLRRLEITRCSEHLSRRCRIPKGEDWFKIEHIPSISISE